MTLRRGPDAIPRSLFLLSSSLVVVWAVLIAESYLIASGESPDHMMSLGLLVIHIGSYWLALQIAGYPARFLQTVTASAICGAMISVLSLVLFLALVPVLGPAGAGSIPAVLQLWMLMVDGHIMARAIEQPLLVGIAIMLIVFFAQLAFYSAY